MSTRKPDSKAKICAPVKLNLYRVDDESAKRSELEKVKREMENQIEELKDDLEAEKSVRTKVEKQKRELSEVTEYIT